MPPRSAQGTSRGQSKAGKKKATVDEESGSSNPFESSSDERTGRGREEDTTRDEIADVDAEEPEKTIPGDLLTRLLHDFFAKESTRISRDANAAVGKYVDVFLREAIARAALERKGGFLEVEDLEKIAPQLLLDL